MKKQNKIEKTLKEFIDKYDWEGLAKAFRDSDIKWHQKEWKKFITQIRQEARKEAIWEMIKGLDSFLAEWKDNRSAKYDRGEQNKGATIYNKKVKLFIKEKLSEKIK